MLSPPCLVAFTLVALAVFFARVGATGGHESRQTARSKRTRKSKIPGAAGLWPEATDVPTTETCPGSGQCRKLPAQLERKFKDPLYLGSGNSWAAWQAMYRGEKVVVKVLKDQTWKKWGEGQLLPALREFEAGRSMKHKGGLGNRGSEYFMDSIDTNLNKLLLMPAAVEGERERERERESEREPAYVVVEFCGTMNLDTFLEWHRAGKTLSEDIVFDIYKQLLDALAYLRRHPDRWVHHDLKPANIGILEIDGKLSVRLLDYGGSAKGLLGHESDITDSDGAYAPPEYAFPYNFAVGDSNSEEDFSRLATSFDLFSLSVVLLEMLGLPKDDRVAIAWHPPQTSKDIEDTVELVVSFMKASGVVDHGHDSRFRNEIGRAFECFSEAKDRPSAEDLLDFSNAQTTSISN